MLKDLGHRVIEAPSGRRALEILRAGTPIDVVVSDEAMPGMRGTELAVEIRASWPDLPVILATGYAELPKGSALHAAAAQALRAGGSGRGDRQRDRREAVGLIPARCPNLIFAVGHGARGSDDHPADLRHAAFAIATATSPSRPG